MPDTLRTIDAINNGQYDDMFARLYGAQAVQRQRQRYCGAIDSFAKLYGAGREIALYSAAGRTEIGGNHTDHNNGCVMAATIDLDIIAVAAKNSEPLVRVRSMGFPNEDVVDLTRLKADESEYGHSAGLIRGVAAGIRERGGMIGGFDAYTTSDVLKGSGLSSSAAFEVCLGAIFNGEYNNGSFSPIQLGIIGQYAENVYFGKPSGLMDQLACAVGGAITIDFADTTSPVVRQMPMDLEEFGYKLVITDTKGSHANLTDEYAAIRREMEAVAACFGKPVLREVDPAAFYAGIADIRGKVGDRAVLRAIHYYNENRRVALLTDALEKKDFTSFLQLIREGGHSSFEYNQNAYSIKDVREQGVALGLALSQHVLGEQGAWRLQGGGFAGTIQAFVPNGLLADYCGLLAGVFGSDACYVLNVRPVGCTAVLPTAPAGV